MTSHNDMNLEEVMESIEWLLRYIIAAFTESIKHVPLSSTLHLSPFISLQATISNKVVNCPFITFFLVLGLSI